MGISTFFKFRFNHRTLALWRNFGVLMKNISLVNDAPSRDRHAQSKCFQSNRHDQSVFSMLVKASVSTLTLRNCCKCFYNRRARSYEEPCRPCNRLRDRVGRLEYNASTASLSHADGSVERQSGIDAKRTFAVSGLRVRLYDWESLEPLS